MWNSLHLLGAALLYQGKVTEAIEVLERASGSRPNFWQARTDLARAYRAAERREEAREELKRIVAAAPLLESAWLAYGDVLVELEKYPDAIYAYERARLADPQDSPHRAGTRGALCGGAQDGRDDFSGYLAC